MNNRKRASILIGGKRRDAACYFDKINARAKQLEQADKPKEERVLSPGEEKQLMLPWGNR